jgi:pimeloyl-ACP methyl ester carboxylesterase
VPYIAGGRTLRDRRQLDRQAETRLAHSPSPLGYWHQLFAITGWSSLPWLHKLPQRTLVVAGDEDPAVPINNGRMVVNRIPHARMYTVRRGGHLFLIDEPESAAPAILEFLDAP